MNKSIAVINRQPSISQKARESLDLALACASYDVPVGLFFIDDGIYQLLAKQQPEITAIKNYTKLFKALELYDIETIYVCEESLTERQCTIEQLQIQVTLLSRQKLFATMKTFNQVIAI